MGEWPELIFESALTHTGFRPHAANADRNRIACRRAIKGEFYEQKIRRATQSDDERFDVDKILMTKKRNYREFHIDFVEELSDSKQACFVAGTKWPDQMSRFYVPLPS